MKILHRSIHHIAPTMGLSHPKYGLQYDSFLSSQPLSHHWSHPWPHNLVIPLVIPPSHTLSHTSGHTPRPYLSLVPFFGILSHFSGIFKNCSEKAPKMRQIRSSCGILQFLPKNVPNFLFIPENFPNFTVFVGVFVKFYYFSPQKSP